MKIDHRRFDGAGIKTTVTFPITETNLHEALKAGADHESIGYTDISSDSTLGLRLDQPMNDPAVFIRDWYIRIGSVLSSEVVDTKPL